jgi:putative ABC transport system ATP-binding protein
MAADVVLRNVRKRFRGGAGDTVAVDDVSLTVPAGQVLAISGPSASGKSTLLHLIGAIERPDAGTIEVGGMDVAALRRRALTRYRRTVGFVFQRYHLLPALTALDNVLAPVLPLRVEFDRTARARELLAEVGLEGRERSLPAQLSGGEQQRVAIARALIGNPSLVLADEPTGNLDSRAGAQIVDLLLRVRDERDVTVIVATHEQHVAARCDRLVRLLDGAIAGDVDLTAGEPPEVTLARAGGLRA